MSKTLLGIVASFIVLLVVSGCSAPAQSQSSAPADAVSIQLSWTYDYSTSPFLAAEKNGHFKEQNLEVTMHEGGFGENGYIEPIQQVVDGSSNFGLTSASNLLLAREQGQPVVAIAAIMQRSPLAVISLTDKNITKPQDLAGHTVLVADGGASQLYNTFLSTQGIDPSTVNTQPRTSFGIEPLLNGETDALVAWVINEGIEIQEAGKTANYVLLSDYGIDTYDYLIFTSEDMIANHPDQVDRFVKAVLAGLDDVIADPEKGAQLAVEISPELNLEGQQARLEASLPLFHPAGTQLGMMDDEVWQFTQQVLLDQKVMAKPVDLKAAYTLQFVQNIVSK